MANTITIREIPLGNVPSGNQTYTVKYKLWNAPSYTTASVGVLVNINGTLVAPFQVAVTPGQTYHLMVHPTCNPDAVFIQEINT